MNVKEKLLVAFDADIEEATAAGNKYAVNDLKIVRALIERTNADDASFMDEIKKNWTFAEKIAYQQAVAYKQSKRSK